MGRGTEQDTLRRVAVWKSTGHGRHCVGVRVNVTVRTPFLIID